MHIFNSIILRTFFHELLKNSFFREEVRVTEMESFHPLVHSPNAHNSWAWAVPDTGAGNSIRIFHLGGRDPTT